MKAEELLMDLMGQGVRFSVVSGRLVWNAPIGAITVPVKAVLGTLKSELIGLLLDGTDRWSSALYCWCCWAHWSSASVTCQFCSAIAPGLSDAEIDAAIYGPGVWL